MNDIYLVKQVNELDDSNLLKITNLKTNEDAEILDKRKLLKINDKFSFIGSDIKIYHDQKHIKRINELIKK